MDTFHCLASLFLPHLDCYGCTLDNDLNISCRYNRYIASVDVHYCRQWTLVPAYHLTFYHISIVQVRHPKRIRTWSYIHSIHFPLVHWLCASVSIGRPE